MTWNIMNSLGIHISETDTCQIKLIGNFFKKKSITHFKWYMINYRIKMLNSSVFMTSQSLTYSSMQLKAVS